MIQCSLKNLFTRSLNAGGSCRSARLNYIVSGVEANENDPGAAMLQEVRSAAPQELDGAELSRVTLIRSHGGGVYEVQAEYEQSSPERSSRKKIGDRLWTFDTTGGKENVIHGKLLKKETSPVSGFLPDPGSLINWNGKNDDRFFAGGTPKIVPSMRENCIAVFRESDVTAKFRRNIMELTGCLNAAPFHSWEPGEVLFLGASSSVPFRNDQGVKITEITFRFAIRRNRESLEVGGVPMGPAGGWDIPWSITMPHLDDFKPITVGAYLSSIYEKGDFSALKL
ncbi:MAG: hypothetical protein J6S54_03210 [Lentisphaeria bacterium]|jgi:hypothetical protein|nr:hypothetical protein [Lentisphaeria bacterium]